MERVHVRGGLNGCPWPVAPDAVARGVVAVVVDSTRARFGAMPSTRVEDHVPEVVALLREIKQLRQALGFSAADVRTYYFGFVAEALSVYAMALTTLHAAHQLVLRDFMVLENGKPKRIEDAILPGYLPGFYNSLRQDGHTVGQAYLAKLRAHLFQDVWAGFEDSTRRFYKAAVSAERQHEDAGHGVGEAPKKHVHVDFPKVWKSLSDMTKRQGTTKADRRGHIEAIDFLGSTRNTLHANTFYEGPGKSLVVGQETLQLVPDKPTDFLRLHTVLSLVRELTEAFEFICRNVAHEAEIRSPIADRDLLQDFPAPKPPT